MRPTCTLLIAAALGVRAGIPSPEGPSQQCRDDAGPGWPDDFNNLPPGEKYFTTTPATPHLDAQGTCPAPLAGACAAKGAKDAFMEGPVDCGGAGWFCRIMPQAGWVNADILPGGINYSPNRPLPATPDRNFVRERSRDLPPTPTQVPWSPEMRTVCSRTDGRAARVCTDCNNSRFEDGEYSYDEAGNDEGHCHGSYDDGTYGWWFRDHWFRGCRHPCHRITQAPPRPTLPRPCTQAPRAPPRPHSAQPSPPPHTATQRTGARPARLPWPCSIYSHA